MSQSKLTVAFAIAGLLAWTGMPADAQNRKDNKAEVQLQAAIHTEMIDGNWKAAIEQYKRLAQGKDRAVAAKALVRMGECYEKMGDAEARKAFERVVREFGDQKEAVSAAQARLSAMGKATGGPSNMRLISKGGYVDGATLDGRYLLQYGKDGALDLRDAQTGQIRHLATKPWHQAVASPDGRQIAFMRNGENRTDLRVVNVDGTAERLLWTSDREWFAGIPQWFPDGKRILVLAWDKQGGRRLMSIGLGESAAALLWESKKSGAAAVTSCGIYSTQLSPDGKSVVFVKRGRNEPVGDELWLLRLKDRSETLLFEGQSYINFPKWTPDGGGVVFLSDRMSPGRTFDSLVSSCVWWNAGWLSEPDESWHR